MNILIICGHGNGDVGATSNINGITRKEASVVRNFVPILKQALLEKGNNVTIYNKDKNAYEELKHNKKAIDFSKYDSVIELHCNSSVNNYYMKDGKNIGCEVYYPSLSNGENIKFLKSLIYKVSMSSGLKNRGVKVGPFLVINTAYSQGCKNACLLELFFINDLDDICLYKKHKYDIANAISECYSNNPFKIKIKTDNTPIYIDYKRNVKHATKVNKNEVFTIVETVNYNGIVFGKLKSGIGYINLNSGVII